MAYCQSARQLGKPAMDIQDDHEGSGVYFELISSVLSNK